MTEEKVPMVVKKQMNRKLGEHSEELDNKRKELQQLELLIHLLNLKYSNITESDKDKWEALNIVSYNQNNKLYNIKWNITGWVTKNKLLEDGYEENINEYEKNLKEKLEKNEDKQTLNIQEHSRSVTFNFLASKLKSLMDDFE